MITDRDLNAAINLNRVGRAHPEPTDACGHDGSVSTETTSMDEAGSESIDEWPHLSMFCRAGIIVTRPQSPFVELVSIGDNIDAGEYAIHSGFHKAVNLVCRRQLVSLVKPEVGAGPVNIVVRGLDFRQVHALRIYQNTLSIDSSSFEFDERLHYDSTFDFSSIHIDRLEDRIHHIETSLLQFAPSKSLAFLLDEGRKQYFRPGFENAVAERLQTGVQAIFHGELLDGVQMIKGVGFGLTPSGDDFITGLLLGLFVIQHLSGKDLSAIREQIYRLALSDNLISNTFLECAKGGLLFERWKSLFSALLYGREYEIHEATQKLLSFGETSGADSIVGFLLTVKTWET